MGSGSEFQIEGAANENDLQPYFFNFADGIIRSLLETDLKLLDGLQGSTFLLYRKVLTHVRL